jgi:hypothetical protein
MMAAGGIFTPARAEPRIVQSWPDDHGTLSGPPVMAIVSVKDQRVSLYDANGGAMRAPVSSGSSGLETPVGTYSILQKNREHYSNVYDDAAMPFMQRITWSGVALHEGQLPGYPASHGCVRLPGSFAEQIFPLTKIGMRVIIARDDIAPVEITHPLLLKPAPLSTAPVATRTSFEDTSGQDEDGPRPFLADLSNWPERQAELEALKTAAAEKASEAEALKAPVEDAKSVVADKTKHRATALKILRATEKIKKVADDRAAAAERALAFVKDPVRLKPWETAKTKADAAVVSATDRLAKATADAQGALNDRQGAKAQRAVRLAQQMKLKAVKEATRADRELTAAKSPGRFKKQEDATAKAAAQAAAAGQKHAVAAAAVQAAEAELQSATEDMAVATARLEAANKVAKEAKRKTLPVSLFVSLKTQRLYVRQGHEPVVDVPVTISEPSKPIGTHVFTAVDYEMGANSLRWTAVSLARRSGREAAKLSGMAKRDGAGVSEPFPTDATVAAAALDRLTLPPEILDRVAASVWPGSSLIVSDEALHKETNAATDFIVLISSEPQGGIKKRPKPAPVREFDDDPWYSDGPRVYDRYGRRMRIQQKSLFDWW